MLRRAFATGLLLIGALSVAYAAYWVLPFAGPLRTDFSGLNLRFEKQVILEFGFVLENKSPIDCQLSTNASDYFVRTVSTGALRQDDRLSPPIGSFVPANQRVEIAFQYHAPYTALFSLNDADAADKVKAFVEPLLAEIDGFYAKGSRRCKELEFRMPLRTVQPTRAQ